MGMEDSFKKQGAVPFKWEIKPGVPKQQHNHEPNYSSISSEFPSLELKPPPSRSQEYFSGELWTRSFRSTTPVRSEQWWSDQPLARSNSTPSGCFISPLLKRLFRWKMNRKLIIEPECGSDPETHSVWSMSSEKFFSPSSN